RRRSDMQFLLAGSLYPAESRWPDNLRRMEHVVPSEHPVLYSSSRATLNLTRREMAESGFCPSGRFFEAAACGTPILTDWWNGLETFFDVEHELRVVQDAGDVVTCLETTVADLRAMAERARARTLEEHTGERRAAQLLSHCEDAVCRKALPAEATA